MSAPKPESRTPAHEDLLALMVKLPGDYAPYGNLLPEQREADCSCGCRFFLPLEGPLGFDWGVCANPASHRVGLLTFEHQGCLKYELDEEDVP